MVGDRENSDRNIIIKAMIREIWRGAGYRCSDIYMYTTHVHTYISTYTYVFLVYTYT